ncbi:hypothetical protein [Dactylosporangium sp. NPDC006015]|uniref:hypothetical protein n=1 Tax=Dactylosporangium sp. NPDC006015 TaxID=3154576 RepID=UPI00339F21A5
MQDQRGNLDETHVPGPRHPSDDDSTDDTAVGTAHTDHETGVVHDADARTDDAREGETYPAGTYASESALTDADHDGIADRDDVKLVDHDQALEEERAEDRADGDRSDDTLSDGGSDDWTGNRAGDDRSDATQAEGGPDDWAGDRADDARLDDTLADERSDTRADDGSVDHSDDGSADWTGERSDDRADDGSGDRTDDRSGDWAGGATDTGNPTRDETAEEIAARDEDEARGDADFVPADIESRADERGEEEAAAAEDAEDRAWAADHATQLRAGSLPEDQSDTRAGDHTAVLADDRTDDEASGTRYADTAVLTDDHTDDNASDTRDARTDGRIDDAPTYAGADDASAFTHADDASDYAATGNRADDDADVDVADDTDADTADDRRDGTLAGPVLTDDPVVTDEPVTAGEDGASSEALEGGEALDAGDVVAVPVPAGAADGDTTGAEGGAGQDLRPGAVETVPVGAIWAEGAADGLRERWRELQLRFIDDPRSVAGEADQLVTEAVTAVTGALESQRAQLSAWQQEGSEDTERLRAAVRQYRDFLDRLLGL